MEDICFPAISLKNNLIRHLEKKQTTNILWKWLYFLNSSFLSKGRANPFELAGHGARFSWRNWFSHKQEERNLPAYWVEVPSSTLLIPSWVLGQMLTHSLICLGTMVALCQNCVVISESGKHGKQRGEPIPVSATVPAFSLPGVSSPSSRYWQSL